MRHHVTKLVLFTVCMFGFGFALVPIYDVICAVTGLNGKTDGKQYSAEDAVAVDVSRELAMTFMVQANEKLPVRFKTITQRMLINPGEIRQVEYLAYNETDVPIVVQAVPSIAPAAAAEYMRKIECFCFDRQTLQPGEEQYLKVLFYLDPDISKEVKELTLSYTLFDVTPTDS